ncbi:MAG TPA: PAS domain-containing protein [Burkholderiaceae bacterium]|nr:PAS domain-containing protein [Burkholderiaceae bacterium]
MKHSDTRDGAPAGLAAPAAGPVGADEAARRSHALLEALTGDTDELVAAQDPAFRYVFFNEAYRREFRRLWGLELEVGVSMPEAMARWPGEARRARELWSRALAGESFAVTTAFGPSDDDRQVYELRFRPVRDEAGRPSGAIHVVRNVTERERLRRAALGGDPLRRRVLDGLPGFVGLMLPDGTLVEANRAPLEAAGLAAAEVIGRKLWDCRWWSHSPDLQARVRDAVERAGRGETVRFDVPVRMAGDGRMWIDFRLAPLRGDDGRITHLVPSATDLTARRQAERALSASEARHRFLLALNEATQHLAEPALVLATAMRMLGETLGADRGLYALVDEAADRADVAGTWARDDAFAFPTGTLRPSDFGAEPLRHYRAGRPFVVVDVDRDERVAPFRDAYRATGTIASLSLGLLRGGRVVAVVDVHQSAPRAWSDDEVALVQDVLLRVRGMLERVQAQRALLDSESRFRQLAEAMPQIVCVIEPPGGIVFVNRRWREHTGLAGTDAGELARAVHPQDLPGLAAAWRDATCAGSAMTVEFRLRRADDGRYRWFLTRAVPVRDDAGRVVRWYGTSTDIDGQKRHAEAVQVANDALRQADRRKDQFLATLAHELRNPLAPVRTSLALIDRETLTERGRCAVSIGQRQLRHITRLVDDLLDVSRISRGKIVLRTEPLDLGPAIESAAESIRPAAASRAQTLRVSPPATPITLVADRVRLAQVIENLLANAVKFTPEGGSIRVETERSGDSVEIRVVDSGVGLAPGQLPWVFELFAQADQPLDRSQGGLGIGLAVVRQLVELHGGSVRADSPGLGMGATFTVRLPWPGASRPDARDAEPSAAR